MTSQAAAFVPCWHFISVPYTYGAPHDSQLVGSHLVCMSEHVWPAASNAVRTLSAAVRVVCSASTHVKPPKPHTSSQERAGQRPPCSGASMFTTVSGGGGARGGGEGGDGEG